MENTKKNISKKAEILLKSIEIGVKLHPDEQLDKEINELVSYKLIVQNENDEYELTTKGKKVTESNIMIQKVVPFVQNNTIAGFNDTLKNQTASGKNAFVKALIAEGSEYFNDKNLPKGVFGALFEMFVDSGAIERLPLNVIIKMQKVFYELSVKKVIDYLGSKKAIELLTGFSDTISRDLNAVIDEWFKEVNLVLDEPYEVVENLKIKKIEKGICTLDDGNQIPIDELLTIEAKLKIVSSVL
jgi:hypothetical protein